MWLVKKGTRLAAVTSNIAAIHVSARQLVGDLSSQVNRKRSALEPSNELLLRDGSRFEAESQQERKVGVRWALRLCNTLMSSSGGFERGGVYLAAKDDPWSLAQ